MISNQSNKDTNESQTMEALVPMVDLFAVLAIMFLIYSNDEIVETKQQNSELIKELVAIEQEKDETQARREALAKKSGKSLEEVKKEREKKSKELIAQFSKMIAAQESQAEEEYQVLIAKIEQDHEVQMQKEEASIEKEKSQQLEKEKQRLKSDLEIKKRQMEREKQKVLNKEKRKNAAKMQAALSEAQAEQNAKVEATRQEVSKQAEQMKTAALAKQKEQMQQQVAKQNAAAQAKAEAEKSQALADAASDAAKKQASALAAAQSESDAKKSQALADAESDAAKKQASALAAAQSESDAKKSQALADAAADAAKQKASELAQQKSAMDQAKKDELDNQKALLGDAADHLAKLQKAADAKDKIVDQLNDNFKDFNSDAVEIDKKTGKVRLHFQESYFVRGAYTLSDDMKKFLRVIIPKYAKSIYGDKEAAKLVKSLKISGMTSPVYFGKYVDKNDISGRAEKARSFNMALSNKRALALYDFIFDEVEMGDYQYRNRLKADMGIAALGYQKAKAVPAELVGKTADCKEYDCKKEQATILQFKLRVDDEVSVNSQVRVDAK